jgi:hypothetical protein
VARPWPVDAREDDVIVKELCKALRLADAELMKRMRGSGRSRGLGQQAASNVDLRALENRIKASRATKTIEVYDLDCIEVKDADMLYARPG